MRAKITKRTVDALQPVAGREATAWDTEVRGFGVRVRSGGAKSYILRYRPGGGRRAPLRTLTIGRHGSPWTPDTARIEAKRLLGLIGSGADPAASRAARRGAPTVLELATRFLAEHVEPKRKPSTAREYRRLIDRVILPVLGMKRVPELTRQDIAKLHHGRQKTPTEANRALAVLSTMLNFAERTGDRPAGSNPCRHIERYSQRRWERILSPEELGRLGEALQNDKLSPYVVAAIKLLVFTGARLGEVLGLRWEWIDFERGEARLPDSKSGAKTIHLPPPALEVLSNLPREQDNPYVIVGAVAGARLVNLEKPWRRIRAAATLRIWRDSSDARVAGLVARLSTQRQREPNLSECRDAACAAGIDLPRGMADVRLHDLRHAFASIAASSGMGLPIIGKMLGHTQVATTARYAHLASDPVKAAAETVAATIAAAMRGPVGRKVIRLRQ
jgi:integrase